MYQTTSISKFLKKVSLAALNQLKTQMRPLQNDLKKLITLKISLICPARRAAMVLGHQNQAQKKELSKRLSEEKNRAKVKHPLILTLHKPSWRGLNSNLLHMNSLQ